MGESASGGRLRPDPGAKIWLDQASGKLVLVDSDNNIIARLGFRPDGTIGFEMVPPGKDVRTADPVDFIVNSAFPTFTIADTNTQLVSRAASADSGSADVETGVLGAPMFFSTVRSPVGSPSFRHQTPFISYNTSGADSGKLIGNKRALYDPSTGVVRFFVEATTLHPSFATAETWEFQYFLMYQNIPS